MSQNTLLRLSLLTAFLAMAIAASPASAAGSASYRDKNVTENFRNGSMLVEYEMYEDAITYLNRAGDEEPNNADVYNLLGFSYRKLGKYETAYRNYQKALSIDPKHRGALEYLGELYVETGQLGKAKQQLAKLDSACMLRCTEYTKLKLMIEEKTRQTTDALPK